MKSGTAKLIDAKENLVFESQYKSCEQWKAIVKSWMELYGDYISNYHIQFSPDVKSTQLPIPVEKTIIIPKIKKKPSDYKYAQLSKREIGNKAFYR
jgi:hypothetical protein